MLSYLYARRVSGIGWRPIDGSALDRTLDLLVALLVSERSYPMFAILVGYGIATTARRLTARGVPAPTVTWVLVRRHLGLLGLGAIHAVLLFNGDVLGLYAITGLLVLPLLPCGARTRAIWTALSLALLAIRYTHVVPPGSHDNPGPSADYLTAASIRLDDWVAGIVLDGLRLMMLGLVLIGVQLSRSGVLDRPWEHVRLLRRLAATGLAANLVLNLPYALAVARVWEPGRSVTPPRTVAHALSGVATGLAYVSLFALLAVRLADRPAGRFRTAVVATGRRSLTCYLMQSLLLAPLLSPWGVGLGAVLGTSAAYLVATAVWAVTVIVAVGLEHAGRRGPAEVVLRALAYGRAGRHVIVDTSGPVR